jgi:hypothetical protein
MRKRFAFVCMVALFSNTSAFAQAPDPIAPTTERSFWDHNGSVMYLVANGSAREIYYHKPRPGMLEAGAHPDSLLFKGQLNDGHLSGTAYLFTANCGQVPFAVKGPIPDRETIVLTGQVPRLGRNCQAHSEYTSTLEFKLLKTAEVAQPEHPSATAQTAGTEESNPEPLSSDTAQPKPPVLPSAEAPQTARSSGMQTPQPAMPESEPKQAGGPSVQPLSPTSAPVVARTFIDRSVLPPLIIALNVVLPFLSILFLIVMLRSNETRSISRIKRSDVPSAGTPKRRPL